MDIWTVVHFLHLLAMAFFIGGQIMLAGVLVPILKGKDEMKAVAKRFGLGSLIALGVLILTGVQMAGHEDAWGDGNLQAKLVILAVLILTIGYHVHTATKRWLDPVIFVLSLAVMGLGVVLAH
ncbi:MAG: hypothetical protein J7513_00785 [Solirubrobacteraceae bacterium]|nr:hypothetical protein [Solirubrobacteraceae bacterium]